MELYFVDIDICIGKIMLLLVLLLLLFGLVLFVVGRLVNVIV